MSLWQFAQIVAGWNEANSSGQQDAPTVEDLEAALGDDIDADYSALLGGLMSKAEVNDLMDAGLSAAELQAEVMKRINRDS